MNINNHSKTSAFCFCCINYALFEFKLLSSLTNLIEIIESEINSNKMLFYDKDVIIMLETKMY
jgi:hypothetical protein